MSTEFLGAQDELDLSGDSAVDVVTSVFTIENAELEDVDSDNGTGTRVVMEFTSDDVPFPITMRFFTSYESKTGKSTDWVKRSRGQLKNIAKAALGKTTFNIPELVGRTVQATTKDGGDGFPVLSRFKAVK